MAKIARTAGRKSTMLRVDLGFAKHVRREARKHRISVVEVTARMVAPVHVERALSSMVARPPAKKESRR